MHDGMYPPRAAPNALVEELRFAGRRAAVLLEPSAALVGSLREEAEAVMHDMPKGVTEAMQDEIEAASGKPVKSSSGHAIRHGAKAVGRILAPKQKRLGV